MAKMSDGWRERKPLRLRKMEKRKGSYWWHCYFCNNDFEWLDVTFSKGIVHFIRDELLKREWSQDCLTPECPECANFDCRITYEFPRKDKTVVRVHHIVGLGKKEDIYIPMMWETSPAPFEEKWFDFKYISERSIWGLNKPAVFKQDGLAELFNKYCSVTGQSKFP